MACVPRGAVAAVGALREQRRQPARRARGDCSVSSASFFLRQTVASTLQQLLIRSARRHRCSVLRCTLKERVPLTCFNGCAQSSTLYPCHARARLVDFAAWASSVQVFFGDSIVESLAGTSLCGPTARAAGVPEALSKWSAYHGLSSLVRARGGANMCPTLARVCSWQARGGGRRARGLTQGVRLRFLFRGIL